MIDTTPENLYPLESEMFNPSFAANATALFNQTPALGPYTLALGNTALYLSLPNITVEYMQIVNKIRKMVADSSAASYLPPDQQADASLVAGYKRQLSIIADLLANPKVPSLEIPFASGKFLLGFPLHPLSRGSVRLDLDDHLRQPILDYRSGSNPVDFDIYLAHIKFIRKISKTKLFQQYGAVEISPGESVQTDDALLEYIKDQAILSTEHPCCTAAMLPRNKAGVVDTDLRVYGANRLRVVDMSILPILPSSHLSATAYAVGEKVSYPCCK
jgi:choline dehydrogenase-like flavoprotein